jgi:ribosomal protein S18 acetylase RimI-like enzyme
LLLSGQERVRTRPATPDDLPAIVRLINRAYRVEDVFVSGDRTTLAEMEKKLAHPHGVLLVMEDEHGALAGSVYIEIRGERGYFGMLSVDPDRQGQGLGRSLVRAIEAHCRAAGCRHLDLDVVSLRDGLPSFYESLGFVAYGTGPFPTPEKLTRDAHLLLMTKPLLP